MLNSAFSPSLKVNQYLPKNASLSSVETFLSTFNTVGGNFFGAKSFGGKEILSTFQIWLGSRVLDDNTISLQCWYLIPNLQFSPEEFITVTKNWIIVVTKLLQIR